MNAADVPPTHIRVDKWTGHNTFWVSFCGIDRPPSSVSERFGRHQIESYGLPVCRTCLEKLAATQS
jgi:hypothetical protein